MMSKKLVKTRLTALYKPNTGTVHQDTFWEALKYFVNHNWGLSHDNLELEDGSCQN